MNDRSMKRLLGMFLGVILAGAVTPSVLAQEDDEERFVVVKAGRIIPVVGKEITDGVIIIVNGKIRNIGKGIEYPGNAKVIDASELTVMPGMINAYSRYGLPGYDAATERQGVRANLTLAEEYFPAKNEYDDVIAAGYTVLGLYPQGRGIPGRAMITRTGGNAAQRMLASAAYLRVLPEKAVLRGALDRAHQEIEKVDKAKKDFEEQQKKQAAQQPPAGQPQPGQPAPPAPGQPPAPPAPQPPAPGQPPAPPQSQPTSQPAASQPAKPQFQAPPIDPAHQPLVDLIQKKEGFFALIEIRSASDYLQMIDAMKKNPIAHSFVARNFGASDIFRVVDKLGESKAKVVCLPYMNRMPFGAAERIPTVALLTRAGCEVSIVPVNDSADEHVRILQRLADLVRDGWLREDALKSVTLNPARLLGLDARMGSIEKDKEADLIFLDGDPLAAGTTVRKVMIAGEVAFTAAEVTK